MKFKVKSKQSVENFLGLFFSSEKFRKIHRTDSLQNFSETSNFSKTILQPKLPINVDLFTPGPTSISAKSGKDRIQTSNWHYSMK